MRLATLIRRTEVAVRRLHWAKQQLMRLEADAPQRAKHVAAWRDAYAWLVEFRPSMRPHLEPPPEA